MSNLALETIPPGSMIHQSDEGVRLANLHDMNGVARRGGGDDAYAVGETVSIRRDGGILTAFPETVEIRLPNGAIKRLIAGFHHVTLVNGRIVDA